MRRISVPRSVRGPFSPHLPVVTFLLGLLVSYGAAGGMYSAVVGGPLSGGFFSVLGGGSNCNQSANSVTWSGYVAETCTNPPLTALITNVSGSWTVPAASCSGTATRADVWLGMDGFAPTSNTVEEIGTTSDCVLGSGAQYFAYFDMVPSPYVPISIAINPGDTIYATVATGGGHFFLTIRDASNGQSFSTIQNNWKAQQSSAEWIVSNPGALNNLPMTPLGGVYFTNCNVIMYGTSGSISGGYWAHDPLSLVTSGGSTIAHPSALTSQGSAFIVIFGPTAANCNPIVSTSYNWGGYLVQPCPGAPKTVTGVQGTWTEPAPVACRGDETSNVVIWVGLDGHSPGVPGLEQIGTGVDCNKGLVTYYAWWEMYPINSVTRLSMAVKPGDTITASLSYPSKGNLTFSITDVSSGATTTWLQKYWGVQKASAEWVVEPAAGFFGALPSNLLNFGTIAFTSCSVTLAGAVGPIDGPWQTNAITMEAMVPFDNPAKRAAPGALQNSDAFNITWLSAAI